MVSRSIGEALRSIDWPKGWREVVTTFATSLLQLLRRHPLVLEAHQRAPRMSPTPDQVVERVLAALEQAGLGGEDAVHACVAVHDNVTGHAALVLGRGESVRLPTYVGPDTPRQHAAGDLFEHPDNPRRFAMGPQILLEGIAALGASTARRQPPGNDAGP